MRWGASLVFLVWLGGCANKGELFDPASVDEDGDGYSPLDDCDDTNASLHPGATENCDGFDNDCDGEVDEGLLSTWYRDQDADGFGTDEESLEQCSPPGGYVNLGGDCDDADMAVHPSAQEVCDGLDNNCSGEIDDVEGADFQDWYPDADNDGYGDASDALSACAQPSGRVATGDDCDDSDPDVNPGVEETWYDGLDSDCDGGDDMDRDGDGAWGGADGTDCDDSDATVYPLAPESCDGVDNDCDGVLETVLAEDFDAEVDPAVLSINGTASQLYSGSDGYLEITAATNAQRGSAFFVQRMPATHFEASFVVEIGEGNAADGLAFAFLTATDVAAMGNSGGGLGLMGLDGYGIELDSHYNSDLSDLTGEHVALVTSVDMYPLEQASFAFRNLGEIQVEVQMSAGTYEVWFDGISLLSGTVANYSMADAMFGFTAATGGLNDAHRVDDIWVCSY